MVQAWQEAGRDLGIRIIAPYPVGLADGRTLTAEAFIPDFGSSSGALAISANSSLCRERELPFWHSQLFDNYRRYDRDRFVETLNDWGWYGTSAPPSWYSGKPWA
jgi:hypothetical protein